jgi:uncharacterized protein YlxW (UPF0749 family)
MSLEILDGPDWLDAQADRHNGQNNDLEADQFRRLAKQWRQDRADHEQLRDEVNALQLQLNTVRRAVAAIPATH